MKESIKKTLTGLLVASCMTMGAFASGQADSRVTASGDMGTIVQGYDTIGDIMVKGISDLYIVQGDTASITINGDQAYLDALDFSNDNGFLQINGNNAGDMDVTITTPGLSDLALSDVEDGTLSAFDSKSDVIINLRGESSLVLEDTLQTPNLRISTSSKSTLEGKVATSELNVRSTGSSSVTLDGEADLFDAQLSQYSNGDFSGLNIQKGNVLTRNNAELNADFPGLSIVSVVTANDSEIELAMNGVLSADLRGDSSLSYSGHVKWDDKDVDDDATLSVN
jgi:hypothetical protein